MRQRLPSLDPPFLDPLASPGFPDVPSERWLRSRERGCCPESGQAAHKVACSPPPAESGGGGRLVLGLVLGQITSNGGSDLGVTVPGEASADAPRTIEAEEHNGRAPGASQAPFPPPPPPRLARVWPASGPRLARAWPASG
eukprot:gene16775-biopygen6786